MFRPRSPWSSPAAARAGIRSAGPAHPRRRRGWSWPARPAARRSPRTTTRCSWRSRSLCPSQIRRAAGGGAPRDLGGGRRAAAAASSSSSRRSCCSSSHSARRRRREPRPSSSTGPSPAAGALRQRRRLRRHAVAATRWGGPSSCWRSPRSPSSVGSGIAGRTCCCCVPRLVPGVCLEHGPRDALSESGVAVWPRLRGRRRRGHRRAIRAAGARPRRSCLTLAAAAPGCRDSLPTAVLPTDRHAHPGIALYRVPSAAGHERGAAA